MEAEKKRKYRVTELPTASATITPHNESAQDSNTDKRSEVDICNVTCTINSSTSQMCHNGGLCLMRHAFWSQTTTEVTVHVPVTYIHNYIKLTLNSSGDSNPLIDGDKGYQICFKAKSCDIKLHESENNDQIMNIILSYSILPDESSWFLTNIDAVQYLVLLLHKAAPLTEYPGCEWWNRVFDEDEKIDTLTCSVGADASQLPEHAQHRAGREHARFQALSSYEKEQELEEIRKYKHVSYFPCCFSCDVRGSDLIYSFHMSIPFYPLDIQQGGS